MDKIPKGTVVISGRQVGGSERENRYFSFLIAFNYSAMVITLSIRDVKEDNAFKYPGG